MLTWLAFPPPPRNRTSWRAALAWRASLQCCSVSQSRCATAPYAARLAPYSLRLCSVSGHILNPVVVEYGLITLCIGATHASQASSQLVQVRETLPAGASASFGPRPVRRPCAPATHSCPRPPRVPSPQSHASLSYVHFRCGCKMAAAAWTCFLPQGSRTARMKTSWSTSSTRCTSSASTTWASGQLLRCSRCPPRAPPGRPSPD